jgi:hypothetical protein
MRQVVSPEEAEMHPTISYELAQAHLADLRRQAERKALARVAPASSKSPSASRKRMTASLPGWLLRRPARAA